MNDQDQRVKPAPFQPAPHPDSRDGATGGAHSGDGGGDSGGFFRGNAPIGADQRRVVLGLLALAAIGVVLFLVLPQLSGPPDLGPYGASTINAGADGAAQNGSRIRPGLQEGAQPPGAAPWADARRTRERKAAQAVLQDLLEAQFELEELQAEGWAAEEFAAAQALAAAGDERYQERDYVEAAAGYQAGLDAMRALRASIPERYAAHLKAGLEALAEDQAEPAIRELELAILLNPDAAEPQKALVRARNVDAVLAQLAAARKAQTQGDLPAALKEVQAALQLDPQHIGAKALLAGIKGDIAELDFKQAMSAGYQALEAGRLDEAEKHFRKARQLKLGAQEPEAALAELRIARANARIKEFTRQATAAAAREDWTQAAAAYREVLNIDSTVAVARNGLAQAEARAELHRRLAKVLANPLDLADTAVYHAALALQRDAQRIEGRGPRLHGQLMELAAVLEKAVIPLPVQLQSDGRTEVTLLRIQQLGKFQRKQLKLKPGVYTALGARAGYRDVRVQFTVTHEKEAGVIDVRCTEAI